MKIDYRAVGGAGGYVKLMDVTTGDTIEAWEPSFSAHAQVEELASNAGQGAGVYTQNLGNIRCDIPVKKMNIVYATRDAAMLAAQSVPAALMNLKVNIRVTEGGTVIWYKGAVTRNLKGSVQGLNVEFNADFVASGTPVTVEPA